MSHPLQLTTDFFFQRQCLEEKLNAGKLSKVNCQLFRMILKKKYKRSSFFSFMEMFELSSVRSGAPDLKSRYCLIIEMMANYPAE